MNIKRILLTGDDGYNSVGTRLLIRALRDQYDLQIAATKYQQSGVGGKLSLETGGRWGESEVDGIPAFWVEGSPADVMECAQGYFKEPFDLLISGVNLGANASSAVISSGTYSAAVRGIGVNVAPVALAISWDAPAGLWQKKHDHNEDISEYFTYPGDALAGLVDLTIKEKLWGVQLLNINLPKVPTNKIKFTKILKDVTQYYNYPITIDHETHRYAFDRPPFVDVPVTNTRYDVGALNQGYISITPCAFDMTHFTTFEKLENQELTV